MNAMMASVGCSTYSLLFVNESMLVCETGSEKDRLARRSFYDAFWNDTLRAGCGCPCDFYEATMEFEHYLNLMDKVHSSKRFVTTGAYVFDLPDYILMTEVVPSYGFVSFVAEIGGWFGLFLGRSKCLNFC